MLLLHQNPGELNLVSQEKLPEIAERRNHLLIPNQRQTLQQAIDMGRRHLAASGRIGAAGLQRRFPDAR